MSTKIRMFALILAGIAVTAAGLLVGAGTSNATVRPSWDRASCPANIEVPGDLLCYWAFDGLSWVAMHVEFDPSTGHDAAWANGVVGQSDLAGILCVKDQRSGHSSCTNFFQGGPVYTGAIPDGPTNSDNGELDLFNSVTKVATYTTTSF